MGLFDWYQPRPELPCPRCGAVLDNWQGKDGPSRLFRWTQGCASPTDQLIDEDVALDVEARARFRLPDEFDFYVTCDSCKLSVDAHGSAEAGVWSRIDVVRPLALPGPPDGWTLIDRSDRALLLSELRRECSADHPLQGQRLLPLARRAGHDDVLVQELRADGRLWLVRLSWKPASDANQPSARSFSSLQSFVESFDPPIPPQNPDHPP